VSLFRIIEVSEGMSSCVFGQVLNCKFEDTVDEGLRIGGEAAVVGICMRYCEHES
jgi:hypothetical protein